MQLMIYKEERYGAEVEIGVKRTHKPGSKHLGPSELEQQGGSLAWRLWRQHGPQTLSFRDPGLQHSENKFLLF